MNWEEKLKTIAKKYNFKDSNLDEDLSNQARETAKTFSFVVLENFKKIKEIFQSNLLSVDIEKLEISKDKLICSISINSPNHNKFKYSVFIEAVNETSLKVSKEYIDGWVINGPIEEKKINLTSKDENALKNLINKLMDDFTSSFELCLGESIIN